MTSKLSPKASTAFERAGDLYELLDKIRENLEKAE